MTLLTRSTVNRLVHVRIRPRPSNIGESRAIMRVLSQFGEIEYYKNLKYDTLSSPTTALVIFKDQEAAAKFLEAEPLRFEISKGQSSPNHGGPRPVNDATNSENAINSELQDQVESGNQNAAPSQDPASMAGKTNVWGTGTWLSDSWPSSHKQMRSLSTNRLSNDVRRHPRPLQLPGVLSPPAVSDGQSSKEYSKLFQLNAGYARAHVRDLIDQSRFHGKFVLDTRMAQQQDLLGRVPFKGLSDLEWRKEKPWRQIKRESDRKSLKKMWEDGLSESVGG